MSAIQHAWLGNYEVSSTTCTGLTFARHSHDECVIGVSGVRLPRVAKIGKSLISRAQELLASQLHQSPPLDPLGNELGLSKFHLLRAFQKETGLSTRQWAMQLRTCRAKGLLRNGVSASDVAHDLGFADQSHLNRHFRAAYGTTPGRYQSVFKR